MIYLDANNDLEADEVDDLDEMLAVGSSSRVNLLVLCARSSESDEDAGYTRRAVGGMKEWTTCRLLRVEKGRLVEVEDWGKASMADGATLERFVKTAMRRWPARHYALNLNDHGLGWPGCCGDDSENDKDGAGLLTLPVIEASLGRALGERKLDLLGFDACLMGSFEVARAVAPHARCMVASEEMEPNSGWSYDRTLSALVAHPEMEAPALGRRIADDYRASFKGDVDRRAEGVDITLSVIDLSRVEAVAEALDRLAKSCRSALSLGRDGWMRVAGARARAEEYGRSEDEGEDSADVYDLTSFADQCAAQLPEARAAAEALGAVMKASVLYSVHGRGRPAAYGLSIFLPRKRAVLEETDPIPYDRAVGARGADWTAFLEAYTRLTGQQKQKPVLGPVEKSASVVRDGKAVRVSAQGPVLGLDHAWFVLAQWDGKSTMLVGQFPTRPDRGGRLREAWDGSWFHLTDGQNDVLCPVSSLEPVEGSEDEFSAAVPVDWRRPGFKQWHDATLHFYVRFKNRGADGRLMYACEETRFGPKEITLRRGDRIRPVYLDHDPDGEEVYVYSEDPRDQIVIARTNAISVDWLELDPDRWRVGFLISDYAGNRTLRLTDIEVK
jgi:hypothetical protein